MIALVHSVTLRWAPISLIKTHEVTRRSRGTELATSATFNTTMDAREDDGWGCGIQNLWEHLSNAIHPTNADLGSRFHSIHVTYVAGTPF